VEGLSVGKINGASITTQPPPTPSTHLKKFLWIKPQFLVSILQYIYFFFVFMIVGLVGVLLLWPKFSLIVSARLIVDFVSILFFEMLVFRLLAQELG